MDSLRVSTYNCFSIRKKVDIVRRLLKNSDILLCQEIILLADDCHMLQNIDLTFSVFYVPSTKPNSPLNEGRPIGGLAMFVRKSLGIDVTVVSSEDHFSVCKITCGSYDFYLINTYMPCDNRCDESLVLYQNVLGQLQGILDEIDSHNVIFAGDFNADKYRGRLYSYLYNFVSENNLTINDYALSSENFTYLSPSHNTTSWIDHVISSSDISIGDITIMYSFAVYDHFPISFKLEIPDVLTSEPEVDPDVLINEFIDWNKFDDEAKKVYNSIFIEIMKNVSIFDDNHLYPDLDHNSSMEWYYEVLIDALKFASADFKFTKEVRFKCVPGWNDLCKAKYSDARSAFLDWVRNNKVRYGSIYERMKSTRKIFRESLLECRRSEQKIRDNKLYSALADGNSKSFWGEVKQRRSGFKKTPDEIDGLKEPKAIAENFARIFSAITGELREDATDSLNDARDNPIDTFKFSLGNVEEAAKRLKVGIGFDGIHSNHIKFLNKESLSYFRNFFNKCLLHKCLPKDMLRGVIRPILKNKFGKTNDSANYREIMISSNIFKLFEYLLLPVTEHFTSISSLQFAYRKNTSTLLATALLKETIHGYIESDSVVYAGFLDLSKAFERVDHRMLLEKLRLTRIPSSIVDAIELILKHSRSSVSFKDVFSRSWKSTRGVRQGGVLSAYLFSFYIDTILTHLSTEPYGCKLGIFKQNCQAYADDLVLYCPSATGLRILLREVEQLMTEHKLCVNTDKTKVVIFRKRKKYDTAAKFFLYGQEIKIINEYKYLGSVLTYNLCEANDISRALEAFNKSVGMFFRKFSSLKLDVKYKLLSTLCLNIYGNELWSDKTGSLAKFRQFGVSYHYAIKKLLGLPKFFSNHYACTALGVLKFKHLVNLDIFRFFRWIVNCESPCISKHKLYLVQYSYLRRAIDKICFDEYNIVDFLDNDFDAVVSRIFYIQNRENSSLFIGL